MIPALRRLGPEGAAGIGCALACAVPGLKIPAAFLLLCILPGLALCRRWLGEASLTRGLLLGGPLSLVMVPLVAIPLALAAGRPLPAATVLSAAALTLLASAAGAAEPRREADPHRAGRAAPGTLGALLALALAAQIVASLAIHPDSDTVRWRGTPDYFFFQGIYTQTALETPPMDPENGAGHLIHNWLYHFHFGQIAEVSGLPIAAMQRLVSAWLALSLLGLVYLIALDIFLAPAAGALAVLFLMTASEARWIVHLLRTGDLDPVTLGWAYTPFGVLLLMGWYNLAPLATLLAGWYALERHRSEASGRWLALSLACCTAAAFFHPILYGVFMIGFVLYLAWLHAAGERDRARWLYLATPIPFFLFYALPYYGLSTPPQVIHLDLSTQGILSRGLTLAYHGGPLWALAAVAAFTISRRAAIPLACLIASPVALWLALRVPNPHWMLDLLSISLALAGGIAIGGIRERLPRLATAAAAVALLPGLVAFGWHVGIALHGGHSFSEGEKAAAGWLRENTRTDTLVAIVPNSEASYPVLGLARRRLVHGWTTHLLDFHADARERETRVLELFRTDDAGRAIEMARAGKAQFLWLGPEAARIEPGSGIGDACFPIRFSSGGVTLREFDCW